MILNVIHYCTKIRGNSHDYLNRGRKSCLKMLHPFMKTLSKLGIKRDFLNLIKGIYEKSTANIILDLKKTE